MESPNRSIGSFRPSCGHPNPHNLRTRFWRRWFLANALITGGLALLWLIFRSGTKPSRLAYPCQQAAFSTAAVAFGVPVVSAVVTARQRLLLAVRRPIGLAVVALVLVVVAGLGGYLARVGAAPKLLLKPAGDYRAKVYYATYCPQDPLGDRFVGLDNLLMLMGRNGLKFYRSPNPGPLAGPDGILAPDDTIVIKINYQWAERGGTNTDVLRGLIWRIGNHPDTFAGEIVVCENAQFASVEGFDRAYNNAQNYGQSPHDVVVDFQNKGYRISHYDWTQIRFTSVLEYNQSHPGDGYVVGPYNSQVQGRVSYPKFKTSLGTPISLKYGIWDPVGQTYDRAHLKLINAPVLKSHSGYGVTACIKDYMGVVTRELSTNSHSAIYYGILGALLGEIRPADLNILDCIWINAIPDRGPSTPYSIATRRDELVASLDPVAADIWAVKNILTPAFRANGYPPPWPKADPDNPNSTFRVYLDNSMNQILLAGFNVTNDPALIDLFKTLYGDLNCDGVVNNFDIDPFTLALTNPAGYAAAYPNCDRMLADCNHDGVVNNFDIDPFVKLLTP